MKNWIKLTLIFAFIFSVSCSQKKAAPIVNNSHAVYGRGNTHNKEKYRESVNRESANRESIKKTLPIKSAHSQEIEVASGETLYSISRKYQVSVRDLIAQNNLEAPYILKPQSRLSIPSATYHEVVAGETLYSISRLYGMKVDQLVEMNSLKEPYSVVIGEKIKISKNSEMSQVVQKPAEVKKPEEVVENTGFVERTLDKLNHFSWPIRGQVASKFGPKAGGLYNDGINIKAKEGTEVKASEDGVVAYVGNELKGYGNLVIIKHGSGWITAYAHLKNATVKRGEKVKKGSEIGLVGATGNVDSPQLYFGLRKGRDAVNPENYLK